MFVVVQEQKAEEYGRQPAVDEITNDLGPMEVSRRKEKKKR